MADLVDNLTVPWVERVSIFAAFGFMPFATILLSVHVTINGIGLRTRRIGLSVSAVILQWMVEMEPLLQFSNTLLLSL